MDNVLALQMLAGAAPGGCDDSGVSCESDASCFSWDSEEPMLR